VTEGLAADAKGRLPTEVSPRVRTGVGGRRRSSKVVAQATGSDGERVCVEMADGPGLGHL